jgi:hypothetical protein
MKFNHHKYTYSRPFSSASHVWELVGPNGAIHFHVSIMPDSTKYSPTAGLEFHHTSGDGKTAPSQLNCNLTGGACWHDGTSLYATESLWPQVQQYLRTGDHESVFRLLEWEYEKHFDPSP